MSDSTDGETVAEESTGPPPACCAPGCPGLCGDAPCPPQVAGQSIDKAEAIGVAVLGQQAVWSTGFGSTMQIVDVALGVDETLAQFPDPFVTRIDADGSDVYFLDYGEGRVRRVSVPGGSVDLVTTVSKGEAQFGAIVVDATHAYFTMQGSGGVWRAAKDLSDQASPEPITPTPGAHGIALDDEFVYFVDAPNAEIRRIALDDIGKDAVGTLVADAPGIAEIDVVGGFVYYGSGGALMRTDRLGSNEGVTQVGSEVGTIWSIDHDETHVYFTAVSGGFLGRAEIEGQAETEVLTQTYNPWGLAVACNEVYWAQNGSQELMMMGK